MSELQNSANFEGLIVDLTFSGRQPSFGDVFAICGYDNPDFPLSGAFDFAGLQDLFFSQVDDYFGVRTSSGEGDDVAVWLYPLVAGEPVHHNPGPFTGLRLQFNVLRNPSHRVDHFLVVVRRMVEHLPVQAIYHSRGGVRLELEDLISTLEADAEKITSFWSSEGIEVGSDESLEVDY